MGILIKYPSKEKMDNINRLFEEVTELIKGTSIDISSPEFEVNGEVNEYGFFLKKGHQQYRFMVCRYLELEESPTDISEEYVIDDFVSYVGYKNFSTFKRKVLGLV